jgi:hypothetical protein
VRRGRDIQAEEARIGHGQGRQGLAVRIPAFGLALQGLPDRLQTGGVLHAVVAHQHRDVGQQGSEIATDVGDAGARIEDDGAKTLGAEEIDEAPKQLEAPIRFFRQETVPPDLLVELGKAGAFAVGGRTGLRRGALYGGRH